MSRLARLQNDLTKTRIEGSLHNLDSVTVLAYLPFATRESG
jgi:hypothetical protein